MKTLTEIAAALLVATVSLETTAADPPKDAAEPAKDAKAPAKAGAKEPIPLAGWRDGPYLKDESGKYFFFLGGRIDLDFFDFAGSGVTSVPANAGGLGLKARLFVRRIRPEFGGELWKTVSFFFAPEFGGQPLGNDNGRAETAAAGAGTAPTADTAQFAPVQSASASASIIDAFVNVRALPELNFQVGQFYVPFGMENQSSEKGSNNIDRPVAVRSFVTPQNRDIGIAVWGDIGGKAPVLSYEAGVFQGDGQNRPGVDNRFDGVGRVFVRPVAVKKGHTLEKFQVGMSARYGDRDPHNVGYDAAAISTPGGWQMWRPTYRDSKKRLIHVLPADAQVAVGGELRVPVWRFDVRSEAYWVDNGTREGVDGFQLTNIERLGKMRGVGWYAQVGVWAYGDTFITGDPGMSRRPPKKNIAEPPKFKHGLELVAVASGVHANYDGASRAGDYDAKTPGSPKVGSRITVYQFGGTANYWVSRNFRASFSYNAYYTPKSGSNENLAQVPGNTVTPADPDAHLLHEFSARLGAYF
jgi:hypothetical protein